MRNEKILHKTHTTITLELIIDLNKVHKSIFKIMLICDILSFIFNIILNIKNTISLSDFVISSIATLMITNIAVWIFYPSTIKRGYYKMLHNKLQDSEYDIYFYENYLERIGEHNSVRIKYEDILNIIETNENIFIKICPNKYISIIKENSDNELLNFLQQIKEDKYKNVNNNKTIPLKNAKFTNQLMNILFLLTFLSLPFAFILSQSIARINNLPINLYSYTMWTFWLVIPIPGVSLILGIIYSVKGHNYQRNKIVSLIVIFFLFAFGSTSTSVKKITYDQISTYNSIINFEIPLEGKYYQRKWDYSINSIDGYLETYIILDENLEENLFTNDEKWLKGNDAKKIKELFAGSNYIMIDNYSYYLIYDVTSKTYNPVYDDNEKHNLIFIKYTPSNSKSIIEIAEYTYCYNDEETSVD